MVALSQTPRNARWHATKDTRVEIGTVMKGSPLHRYATIMLRAVLLLGVGGLAVPKANAAEVATAMMSAPATTAATAATATGTGTDICDPAICHGLQEP